MSGTARRKSDLAFLTTTSPERVKPPLKTSLSQSQTKFLHVQKVTPNEIRSHFDSVYLRPEENPRVINYSDPAKAHVMGEAAKRYFKKQEDHEDRNRRIEARIEKDIQRGLEIAKQTSQVLTNRMQETKETLSLQTERKVSLTDILLLPLATTSARRRSDEQNHA
jgi:hypothetical protein